MMRYSTYFLAIIYFGISGCATGPVTYQEIEQAMYDTREAYVNYDHDAENEKTLKQVAKAMDKAQKRFDVFEANVTKAEILFAWKAECGRGANTTWYCPRGLPQEEPRGEEPLYKYVKRYKVERDAQCMCANSDDVMRAINRIMR